ncbi:hypothetical protein LY76DRAFT_86828 [Colletotrichum caudatum]|nr:hypothetical protein LY76DRAFT_86828 [Colletotrichum caudatum]
MLLLRTRQILEIHNPALPFSHHQSIIADPLKRWLPHQITPSCALRQGPVSQLPLFPP